MKILFKGRPNSNKIKPFNFDVIIFLSCQIKKESMYVLINDVTDTAFLYMRHSGFESL